MYIALFGTEVEPQNQESEVLSYALKYLKLGFSIIPIRGKHYSNGDEGLSKGPLVKWTEFQHRHPTEKEVSLWFTRYPKANIAVVTGSISGIVVVDFDSEQAVNWAKQKGLLNTPLVKTARGLHAYYKHPGGLLQNVVDPATHIDIRADGGYVVLPPSIHFNGHKYMWISGHTPEEIDFADFPEYFFKKASENKQQTDLRPIYKGVSEGNRNTSLARLVGSWVNDGLSCEECMEMAFLWNQKNDPPMKDKEVEQTVLSIYRRHINQQSTRKTVSRIESNLLYFPICTRNKELIHNPGKIECIMPKKHKQQRWTVLSCVEFGLPGPFDEDVLMCILEIASQKSKPVKNPINIGYLKDIAKMLKIYPDGKNIYSIKQSIKRLKSLTLISEETFYDNNKKRFVTDMFNLFDRVLFKGESSENDIVEKGNFIWLNKMVLDNINTDYFTAIDFDFYTNLNSSIAKGLYKILSFIFALNNKNQVEMNYTTLIQKLQIKEMQYPSYIKKQISPACTELQQKGFLSKIIFNQNKVSFFPA